MTDTRALLASKDVEAIKIVREMSMTTESRAQLWRLRFDRSPLLQNEFRSAEAYASYMDTMVQGRARIVRGGTVTVPRDQR